MAKPLLEPTRWATDGTNNVPGSSGQKDTGWTTNQVAVSSYFNALAKAYYDWFQWIDSGDLDAVNLHLTGNLTVDGNTTLGNAAGDTVTVSGTPTFATDVTLAANKDLVLSGTGNVRHGDYIRPFTTEQQDVIQTGGTVSAVLDDGGSSVSASTYANFRLPVVDTHERLKGYSITGTGTSSSAQLLRYNVSNATYAPVAVVGGTGTGNSVVGIAGGTWDLVPTTPAANSGGYIYVVKITTNVAGATLRMGLMTFDVP